MGRRSRFLRPVAQNQHCKAQPARCSRKNALARIRAIQDWQEIRVVDRTTPVTPIENRGRSGSAIEVLLAFAKLGVSCFGGPIAHIGYFRQEFVVRRGWVGAPTYPGLFAPCPILPGPGRRSVAVFPCLLAAGYLS